MSHDIDQLRPKARVVEERKHRRVSYRNVKAAIRTKLNTETIVVDILNISRGGLCFASFKDFHRGMPIAVATHYVEGGQNIFQNGWIVRVQRKPTKSIPGEFAIKFAPNE